MPKRHYAGTSRGGPIVATRDVIVECGRVETEENLWTAWLHVDREEEREEEEKKKKEKGNKKGKNDDEVHRRERIADKQTERHPRGFSSHGRG